MTRSTRRAIISLVIALTIAAGASVTIAQPTQTKTQQAATLASGLPVDPVLGLTAVQVVLIAAGITALATLIGVGVGGTITYKVRSRLDKKRRAEVEKRLAYAQLVQVTAFAAGTRTALDRITPFGKTAMPPPNKKLQEAMDKGEIPKPVAWCALIASTLDDRKFRNVLRPMIGLFADSTASFNDSLSAMQIRGKDFADVAPPVIAAHSAAVKELAGCNASFKALTAAFADDAVASDVLGRMALATWQSMNRVASSLEALRVSLITPSMVTADEAARMYADLEAFATTGADTGITSNMAFDRAMKLIRASPGSHQ